MMHYSEPRKNWKGLWEVEVTREDGFKVLTKYYTTKKEMTDWLKQEKANNKKGEV